MLEEQAHPDATPSAGRRAPIGARWRGGLWSASLQHLGQTLLEAIFPRRCAACRRYGVDQERDPAVAPAAEMKIAHCVGRPYFQWNARHFLCPNCLADCASTVSPLCHRCGLMFVSREGEDRLCGDCLQQAPSFRRARAAGVYSGGMMALIHQLKYRGCLSLVDPLATLLRDAYDRFWPSVDIDLVLPIPLHAGRLRRRGFNQSQLLAEAWARAERCEERRGLRFAKARGIFIRSRATTPQTGLGKMERRRNMRGAFTVLEARAIAGRRILLLDDVYTTGATANAAAQALIQSGADEVDILTVARTMPRER